MSSDQPHPEPDRPAEAPPHPDGHGSNGEAPLSQAGAATNLNRPLANTGPDEESTNAKPPIADSGSRPNIEMSLSESTLHWLVDADEPMALEPSDAVTEAGYEARAAVPGARRALLFIGGAGVLALIFAFILHVEAERHKAAVGAQPVPLDSSAVLTQRAQAALVGGRPGEALDFARLAVDVDPGAADAYYIIAILQRSGGRTSEARDAFRHYLDAAPLGVHASDARKALKQMAQ
jgi:hypothetical protein